MTELLDKPIPTGKIYKDKAIWTATFLGGPMVAGYLIAQNFKAFNDPDKVKQTWIYAIIASIIIFGGIFLIPSDVKIPNQVIPLLYTGFAYYLVQHFQGQKITEHINAGGSFFGWGRTIGIAILGLVITILPVFCIAYYSISSTSAETTTKIYGVMKNEIDFQKNNISESEVDKLADAFTTTTFFDEAVKKYVYVEKVGRNYEISISCDKSVTSSSAELAPFIQLQSDMQALFTNNKIVLKLVVETLDNVVKRIE